VLAEQPARDRAADSGAKPRQRKRPHWNDMPPQPLREPTLDVDTSDTTAVTTRVPEIGPWGFDLSGMDERVRPGDSFYEYCNGRWLTRHSIPENRTYWSTFAELRQRTEERVRHIVEHTQHGPAQCATARKVHDFYRAFLDSAHIEALGLDPLEPGLEHIRSARTHADLARLLGRADLGLLGPVKLELAIDDKNPKRYVVLVTQSGLSMPDRDYYLSAKSEHVQLRAAYLQHVARVLTLLGVPHPRSAAGVVLELETAMARLHWPVAKRRERELTYNPRSRAELMASPRRFSWYDLLSSAGLLDHDAFVVAERDAVEQLLGLFESVAVSAWQSYLTYHYAASHAALLPAQLDSAHFDFYGRALNGLPEQLPRDKRAVAAVNEALGEAVGELYVAQYFPASHKQRTLELVDSLRKAFATRLRELPWLSHATKIAAARKLESFVPKIGFPDKWRDYSEYRVVAGDAFGNAVRGRVWRWQRDLERLTRAPDRGEWSVLPQTVNASYDYTGNEIIFPAAILQAPFFDPQADAAVNYGAIGAVIGHEMGHGFDDQGSKSDEHGVLRTWWQSQDSEAFAVLVDKLVSQYSEYEVLPGVYVNGRLTVGENIGDLGGLSLAYAAYRASLHGREAPVLDGFTGDQRFFLAWAQIWRQLRRAESQRNLLLSDPHSPSRLRVDGVVRNLDAFYRAFDVQPTDALWLDPRQRVSIW
jgi:putative endopeptidase